MPTGPETPDIGGAFQSRDSGEGAHLDSSPYVQESSGEHPASAESTGNGFGGGADCGRRASSDSMRALGATPAGAQRLVANPCRQARQPTHPQSCSPGWARWLHDRMVSMSEAQPPPRRPSYYRSDPWAECRHPGGIQRRPTEKRARYGAGAVPAHPFISEV